jgi:RNAse (barnase) inhibitor barstar
VIESNLKAILRNAEAAGSREYPPAELLALKAASDELQFPFAHIDLSTAQDKEDLFAALSIALRLPDWFGHNWDALADCLCDLSWKPAPGYVVYIEGHDALRHAKPADFDMLIEIFGEAAAYWSEEGIRFWTLFSPPRDGTSVAPPLIH